MQSMILFYLSTQLGLVYCRVGAKAAAQPTLLLFLGMWVPYCLGFWPLFFKRSCRPLSFLGLCGRWWWNFDRILFLRQLCMWSPYVSRQTSRKQQIMQRRKKDECRDWIMVDWFTFRCAEAVHVSVCAFSCVICFLSWLFDVMSV